MCFKKKLANNKLIRKNYTKDTKEMHLNELLFQRKIKKISYSTNKTLVGQIITINISNKRLFTLLSLFQYRKTTKKIGKKKQMTGYKKKKLNLYNLIKIF